jgi:hypothetical protein
MNINEVKSRVGGGECPDLADLFQVGPVPGISCKPLLNIRFLVRREHTLYIFQQDRIGYMFRFFCHTSVYMTTNHRKTRTLNQKIAKTEDEVGDFQGIYIRNAKAETKVS